MTAGIELDRVQRTHSPTDGSWRWPTLAVVVVLAIVTVVLWASPAPVMAPWDVFVLLDGGYRMLEGQLPSTDYANPVGPLVYGLVSLGMRLHGVSLAAVAWGNTLMVLLGCAFTWYATRTRMHSAWCAAATTYAALLLSAVRPLGYPPDNTTYAMLYNRYGWVLFTLVVIMVVLRPSSQQSELPDHLALGALLGLLFFTKITFALAAAAVILLGLTKRSDMHRLLRVLALMIGFLVVAVTVAAVFGVDPIAYVNDVADSAAVQSKSRLRQIASVVIWTAPVWVLTAAILAALMVSARRRHESLAWVWVLTAQCGAITSASILLSAGDAVERSDVVSLAVLPLVIVSSLARQKRSLTKIGIVAVTLLLLGTAGSITAKDLGALANNVAMRHYVKRPPPSQHIDSLNLSDFVVPNDSQWVTAYRTAHQVPAMVNDGIGMLRRHIGQSDRVFTLAFGSPFDAAMKLRPTKGGLLWYDLGFDMDRKHHPSAQEALGTADWVMVPQMVPDQGCCQETVQVLSETYGPYIETHFKPVERSENWTLLQRTT